MYGLAISGAAAVPSLLHYICEVHADLHVLIVPLWLCLIVTVPELENTLCSSPVCSCVRVCMCVWCVFECVCGVVCVCVWSCARVCVCVCVGGCGVRVLEKCTGMPWTNTC